MYNKFKARTESKDVLTTLDFRLLWGQHITGALVKQLFVNNAQIQSTSTLNLVLHFSTICEAQCSSYAENDLRY